jgi:hypothetical protein
MPLDENDGQLLGLMEFNGSELYDAVGTQYGRSAEICRIGAYS